MKLHPNGSVNFVISSPDSRPAQTKVSEEAAKECEVRRRCEDAQNEHDINDDIIEKLLEQGDE